jgi:hypothetical protein
MMANKENLLKAVALWNEACEMDFSRPYVPRDYMWASEIGGAFVDRFLKMSGVKPSNPPNARARRKFKSGDIWEWIVWYLFERAGLLINAQEECYVTIPGCIPCKGKLDMLIGGTPNLQKGLESMKSLGLPEFFDVFVNKIIEYAFTFDRSVLEVKSTSAFMFEHYEATRKANRHHLMQCFHYCYSKQLPGAILYISKDDCRMLEFHVDPNDPELFEIYKSDAERFTRYYTKNEQPPLESLARIDDEGWWEKNWHIEYSGYLTMLYGYETPDAYRDDVDKFVSRWNRVIDRIYHQQKPPTADNRTAISEMKTFMSKYPEGIMNAEKLDWINHV